MLRSWLNPTSVLGGVMAVIVCAFLAAVYLAADAERRGRPELVRAFRLRSLAVGVAGRQRSPAVGVAVLHADSPSLFHGLTHRGAPLIGLSAAAGALTLLLVARHRFAIARYVAALAVVAVLWGWAAGQYPWMLEHELTIKAAAAPRDARGRTRRARSRLVAARARAGVAARARPARRPGRRDVTPERLPDLFRRCDPAVDGEHRAGHVRAGATREEDRRAGHVVGAADAVQRRRARDVVTEVAQRRRHHLRLERTRRDRVHGDVLAAEVAREVARQLMDRGLARRVRVRLEHRDLDRRRSSRC